MTMSEHILHKLKAIGVSTEPNINISFWNAVPEMNGEEQKNRKNFNFSSPMKNQHNKAVVLFNPYPLLKSVTH